MKMSQRGLSMNPNFFFCFKYRHMSFKEELHRKKLSLPFNFWKIINFPLNRVDILVKKFLTKKIYT